MKKKILVAIFAIGLGTAAYALTVNCSCDKAEVCTCGDTCECVDCTCASCDAK